MADDSAVSVVRRLVSLMSNSYLPPDRSPAEQCRRCLAFLGDSPAAARAFYMQAHAHVDGATASECF